jgi:hypothetical protein
MPKKSLIQQADADVVKHAHNCQANAKHRLHKGDVRMRVLVKRSHDHYCKDCALSIIEQDIIKLEKLRERIMSTPSSTTAKTGQHSHGRHATLAHINKGREG